MVISNANFVNHKLPALNEVEGQRRARIAQKLIRAAKREERDDARMGLAIGTVLVQNAGAHPDFELLLKRVQTAYKHKCEMESRLLAAADSLPTTTFPIEHCQETITYKVHLPKLWTQRVGKTGCPGRLSPVFD